MPIHKKTHDPSNQPLFWIPCLLPNSGSRKIHSQKIVFGEGEKVSLDDLRKKLTKMFRCVHFSKDFVEAFTLPDPEARLPEQATLEIFKTHKPSFIYKIDREKRKFKNFNFQHALQVLLKMIEKDSLIPSTSAAEQKIFFSVAKKQGEFMLEISIKDNALGIRFDRKFNDDEIPQNSILVIYDY
jgi:hypothetical protein